MVRLLVTYMEQRLPPAGPALPPPRADARVAAGRLTPAAYLALYRAVGGPVQWDLRLRMAPAALARFLASAATHLFLLELGAGTVGFCEAADDGEGGIEILHFGLVPAAKGQRLGPYLLDQAARALWDRGPRRLWLHTDTCDDPAAIPVYRRAGFVAWRQSWETFPD
jgi:ribosomal protein S18 acetylase RimI-like enzyme